MNPFSSGLPGVLQDVGLVLGLVISLAIGSYLVRDSFLARLGQYILVGAGLGYTAVLVWGNVLWPRLFAPLIEDPGVWLSMPESALLHRWLPLVMGLLMWLGGLELLRRPPSRLGGRYILRLAAVVPAAILVGVGLGAGVSGTLQGTLLPQLNATAQLPQTGSATAGGGLPVVEQTAWSVRFVTLVITGGVLILLQFGREAGGNGKGTLLQPSTGLAETASAGRGSPQRYRMIALTLLRVWEGIGRRALWLAAGIIFARLALSRFSLALARLDYFLFDVPRSDLWQLFWAAVRGTGS